MSKYAIDAFGNIHPTSTVTSNVALSSENIDNASNDMEDWDSIEVRRFIKWFVNMHYPEAVEQFQAIRKIERANEEQIKAETVQAQLDLMKKYWDSQVQAQITPSQVYSQSSTKSVWDRMKEMAGYGSKSHGDYY